MEILSNQAHHYTVIGTNNRIEKVHITYYKGAISCIARKETIYSITGIDSIIGALKGCKIEIIWLVQNKASYKSY